jgi:hypothetical protein
LRCGVSIESPKSKTDPLKRVWKLSRCTEGCNDGGKRRMKMIQKFLYESSLRSWLVDSEQLTLEVFKIHRERVKGEMALVEGPAELMQLLDLAEDATGIAYGSIFDKAPESKIVVGSQDIPIMSLTGNRFQGCGVNAADDASTQLRDT